MNLEDLMTPIRLLACLLVAPLVSAACHSSDIVSVLPCSTAALSGSYGVQRNGTTAPGTHWTSVGVATFDGKGNALTNQAVSVNGTFSSVTNQVGTYVINPDCTGTESDASGAVLGTLVMVHGADEVLGISVVPGNSITVHYERIVGSCLNSTLTGDYGFQRNGQNAAGAAVVSIGHITFDGNGNQTVVETTIRGGVASVGVPLTGTYAINPDCTGTQTDRATGKIISQLAVVHGGDEVLGMSETAGNNIVIHYEKVK
jgi:hypothetical protein